MNKKHLISLGAGLLLAFAGNSPCTAQRRVSLADCLSIAEQNSLSMKAGSLLVERAKAMQGTAFNPDKTSISLSQDPTSGGSPDNALTFSQSFAFPTVYTTKHKLLKEETRLEAAKLEMTRQELQKSVSAQYCGLLYIIERRRILTRQAATYKRFLQLADVKLKYGETGKLEQMNALRLCRETETALKNADRDVETSANSLRQLLNTDEEIMPAEDSLTIIDDRDVRSDGFNPAETPLGRMLSQQQQVSEQNIKVERQGFMPDFTVAASSQLLIKSFNPYDVDRSRFADGNFMGFEVGVSVPLFFGAQRARLKAAKREAELTRTATERQLRQLQSERVAAHNSLMQAQANLNYYRTEGIQQAEEIERISQVSYEKGAIGYMEYIQNIQTAVDIRNAYATAVNEYNQAVINLRYLQNTNDK